MTPKKTSRSISRPQSPADGTAFTADAFGHSFKDESLLHRALTHRSLAYETAPESLADPNADNEQLEFVGDAVLGLVVAEALYRRFPRLHEGELTQLRASLVSRKHLGAMATRIDLGSLLKLGEGGGAQRWPLKNCSAVERTRSRDCRNLS